MLLIFILFFILFLLVLYSLIFLGDYRPILILIFIFIIFILLGLMTIISRFENNSSANIIEYFTENINTPSKETNLIKIDFEKDRKRKRTRYRSILRQ